VKLNACTIRVPLHKSSYSSR
jgi:hypothetical protein